MFSETDAGRLAHVLLRIRRALRRRTRAALGAEPLPQAQLEVMLALAEEPGLTVGQLARRLQLAINTVSTLGALMVAQGHLERSVDPADRRVIRLRLTEAARARMERWRDLRAVELASALEGLEPPDRRALLAALAALDRLANRLEGPL